MQITPVGFAAYSAPKKALKSNQSSPNQALSFKSNAIDTQSPEALFKTILNEIQSQGKYYEDLKERLKNSKNVIKKDDPESLNLHVVAANEFRSSSGKRDLGIKFDDKKNPQVCFWQYGEWNLFDPSAQ